MPHLCLLTYQGDSLSLLDFGARNQIPALPPVGSVTLGSWPKPLCLSIFICEMGLTMLWGKCIHFSKAPRTVSGTQWGVYIYLPLNSKVFRAETTSYCFSPQCWYSIWHIGSQQTFVCRSLISDSQPQNCEKALCCSCRPVYGILLWQPDLAEAAIQSLLSFCNLLFSLRSMLWAIPSSPLVYQYICLIFCVVSRGTSGP